MVVDFKALLHNAQRQDDVKGLMGVSHVYVYAPQGQCTVNLTFDVDEFQVAV
jgi:hypothetical protein